MADITKTYVQDVPAFRFIGKTYGDSDRVNGGFSAQWGEAFETGLFERLKKLSDEKLFEDADAYIGLMRCKDGEPFVYAIGMFCPADAPVPEDLDGYDFPAARFGIGWLYGKEPELYGREPQVAIKLDEAGYPIQTDEKGACLFFERYACPRFTTPDEQGNVTLDIGFFVG